MAGEQVTKRKKKDKKGKQAGLEEIPEKSEKRWKTGVSIVGAQSPPKQRSQRLNPQPDGGQLYPRELEGTSAVRPCQGFREPPLPSLSHVVR